MYNIQEETEILHGVGDVILSLHSLPIDDIAYFLVEYDPELAERLADAIEFSIFDKEMVKNGK